MLFRLILLLFVSMFSLIMEMFAPVSNKAVRQDLLDFEILKVRIRNE